MARRDAEFMADHCVGKARFANPTLAVKVIQHRRKMRKFHKSGEGGGGKYRCPNCGGWHLGREWWK